MVEFVLGETWLNIALAWQTFTFGYQLIASGGFNGEYSHSNVI